MVCSKESQDEYDLADFITQTDANGKAIVNKKSEHKTQGKRFKGSKIVPAEKESATEKRSSSQARNKLSFVESLQSFCCYAAGVENDSPGQQKSQRDAPRLVRPSDQEIADEPLKGFLLPPKHPKDAGKKTLVLDLDETLVHSTFKAVPWADFAIPVRIGDQSHYVYVTKRPGVDEFLVDMSKYYEIVIYTASRDKYANPLLDILDEKNVIRKRLYREDCLFNDGTYVKDLSKLGRDLKETIIVDNAPHSYVFHQANAIDCSSFIDDNLDKELYQIGAFLKEIRKVKDVRDHCHKWKDFPNPMMPKNSRSGTSRHNSQLTNDHLYTI